MVDESNNGVVKGWTKLLSGHYLLVEEVMALMEAFKAKGNSKGEPLALKPFLKVVEEVNCTYHQPLFNHNKAQLTFHLLNTNHNGKEQDKAKLMFKAINLNNNRHISKPKLLSYLEIMLVVVEKITKEHIKWGKLANKKELLNIATNHKKSLLESSIDEVFEADTNQDGSIDLEEWKAGAVNNVTIKSLINLSRSVYAIQETIKRGSGIPPCPS